MAKIGLSMPVYDGQVHVGAAMGFWDYPSERHEVFRAVSVSSLIAFNCNTLLRETLNQRESLGLEWFAMLHADIAPEKNWIDKLIEQAEIHQADFVSAVAPLKDQDGATSTAIANPAAKMGFACRLTQAQVNQPDFPLTFGIDECVTALSNLAEPYRVIAPRTALLCNTGCMIYRLNRPWMSRVFFDELNTVQQNGRGWERDVFPEDWFFSRSIAEHGGKVMATKAVRLTHWGKYGFRSNEVWGLPKFVS